MAELGYAQEYEAFIVNSKNQNTLVSLPWSAISWQRVKNEISAASVNVAEADGGIECCGAIGGLFPWGQMLRIERNGEVVWDGPIRGWTQPQGTHSLTIKAMDRSVLFQKRLIAVHRAYTNAAPYTIAAQVITDAHIGNIAYDPYPVAFGTVTTVPGERATREYFVERLERVYDVLKELTQNTYTGFWTTAAGIIYLDALTIADGLGRAGVGLAPKLNEFTTIGPPGIDVDGIDMATVTYAGGAGQGTNGFPLIVANNAAVGLFLTSTLEKASAEDRSVTDLSLVAGRGAAESAAPQVTVEKIQLSPLFGSEFLHANLDNLLPGVQFDINFEETCAFSLPLAEYRETAGVPGIAYVSELTKARLDQLDVEVARTEGGGITERVLASYRPFITDDISSATGGTVPDPDRWNEVDPTRQHPL